MGLNRSSEFKTTHFVFRPIYNLYLIVLYVNMFKKKRLGNKYRYLHQFIGSKLHHRQIHGILVFINDKKKHGTTSEERQSFRKWMTAAVIFITDYCRQFFNWCYSPYTDDSYSMQIRWETILQLYNPLPFSARSLAMIDCYEWLRNSLFVI